MESVYLDTTIPSYYVDRRDDLLLMARREITVTWWDGPRLTHDICTSAFVIAELRRGAFAGQDEALRLMKNVPLLEITDDIREITEVYIAHKLMPEDLVGDAAHLAIASFYKIDYLLTWNLQHLANVHKLRHIRVINGKLGLFTPEIVTPEYFFDEGVA